MDMVDTQTSVNGMVSLPSSLASEPSSDVRRLGINPNHWYAVARSRELKDKPLGVVLWHEAILLYRDSQGTPHAIEDRCPHRHVRLSEGHIEGDNVVCAYHGWHFNHLGACTHVPYLGADQKLPTCTLRGYPIREQDGFIWVFPGDVQKLEAEALEPMPLPEWDDLGQIGACVPIDVQCHFSFLIENLVDMYHGHLHQDLQAWHNPVLQSMEETSERVDAHYQAQSYYKVTQIWSVLQLFIPAMRKLHPEPLDVSYIYPNWRASLGEDFRLACLFCPVDETRTRAYLMHFTSIHAFKGAHKMPLRLRHLLKDSLFGAANGLLNGLVKQDVVMLEQEQQAYLANPNRKGPELNKAILGVQRLIRNQAHQAQP